MDKPKPTNWFLEIIGLLLGLFVGWLGVAMLVGSIYSFFTIMELGQSDELSDYMFFLPLLLSIFMGMLGFMLVVSMGYMLVRTITTLGQRRSAESPARNATPELNE